MLYFLRGRRSVGGLFSLRGGCMLVLDMDRVVGQLEFLCFFWVPNLNGAFEPQYFFSSGKESTHFCDRTLKCYGLTAINIHKQTFLCSVLSVIQLDCSSALILKGLVKCQWSCSVFRVDFSGVWLGTSDSLGYSQRALLSSPSCKLALPVLCSVLGVNA